MSGAYFEDGENYKIIDNKKVKMTSYSGGEIVEILDTSNKKNYLACIKKIDKNRYIDLRDGETKQYNKSRTTKSNDSIRKSMRRLERILRNNFKGESNELYITLTTAGKVTDVNIMKKYFKRFWNKLKKIYGNLIYVYIIEQHKDMKSWHIHCLIKAPKRKYLYIDNKIIRKLWEKGNTVTLGIKKDDNSIDRVITYLSKQHSKRNIPVDTRCYYKSKGVKMPEVKKVVYSQIRTELDSHYELSSEQTTLLRSERTDAILNKIKKETWKKL